MTCDQLDDLRDDKGAGGASRVPPEVREHMQNCHRCRELQAIWDSPLAEVEIPGSTQERIAESIIAGLRPVSPLPSDTVLMTWILLLTALAVAAGAVWLGVAGYHVLSFRQLAILFPLLAAGLVLAARVIVRQIVPGASKPASSPLAIVLIFICFAAAVFALFPYQPDPKFLPIGLWCWERGLSIAAAVALVVYPALRRGVWLTPVQLGAATGCLSGLAGLAVLEICCPHLDRGHIDVWHVGSALTAIVVGVLIALAAGVPRGKRF